MYTHHDGRAFRLDREPCAAEQGPEWIREAIADRKENLPFPMRWIDSDNGSEFKNFQLLGWCTENGIQFTRSRSYRKNDSVVRNIVGYLRFKEEAREAMAELYAVYGLIVNYFYPSMKILSKECRDAKIIKKYDRARTPYVRLMEYGELDDASKDEFRSLKNRRNSRTGSFLWLCPGTGAFS